MCRNCDGKGVTKVSMPTEEEGQGLVEYALVIVLIVIVVALVYLVVWPAVKPVIDSFFSEIIGVQGTP
jgi:Flp pilus assembly pilin Flp